MTTTTTRSIDAAAFAAATTGEHPTVTRDFDGQGVFAFTSPAATAALAEYATSPTAAAARRLLTVRRSLFHTVRELRNGGGR